MNKHEIFEICMKYIVKMNRQIGTLYTKSKDASPIHQRREVIEGVRKWVTHTVQAGYHAHYVDPILDQFKSSLQGAVSLQRAAYYFWYLMAIAVVPAAAVYVVLSYMPKHHPDMVQSGGIWILFTYLCVALFSLLVSRPAIARLRYRTDMYTRVIAAFDSMKIRHYDTFEIR